MSYALVVKLNWPCGCIRATLALPIGRQKYNLGYGLSKMTSEVFKKEKFVVIPVSLSEHAMEGSIFESAWKTIGYTLEYYLREGIHPLIVDAYYLEACAKISALITQGYSEDAIGKFPIVQGYLQCSRMMYCKKGIMINPKHAA